ncbi:UDP-glucose/GDP-mannose dehydrogenase family protein [Pseudomonas sp. NFIX28]|uniref:UDP-glucose dehydrogenase family protein n=1 Tax=Pseudomonas sp. NFIX28 TaxID=1566235 RepID=UPI000899D8FC|nr:UDP-glucose/GDP-mannose dehydrogenase family protein [Pseudomonas sp. NFIX28]SDY41529.1 UDPglucose 6-dehydrogenase [Pseudomonas sp. NFIX28]
MNITLFGTGYVGLTLAVCLAQAGHDVCCTDVDRQRLAMLQTGRCPFFEPGLEALLKTNLAAGRVRFTDSAADAVDFSEVVFIAVGTPADEDGSANLDNVLAVARAIATHAQGDKIVINKSTSPVGTAQQLRALMARVVRQRGCEHTLEVLANPEFLKEGSALDDCMRPDRIVVGIDGTRGLDVVRAVYAPFSRNHEKLIVMDSRSAELTKYAANSMLATRVSFINEMANLAERLGADIEMVRLGIGSDTRIGHDFIYPGCGFGGSCFPKDIRALRAIARQEGCQSHLLDAVEAVNQRQKTRVFEHISAHYHGDLRGKTFAVWGLSFKPDTDDMREAPSRVLLEALWSAGAQVRAFDPEAMEQASRLYGERPDLRLVESQEAALEGAHALVIMTEWRVFRACDLGKVRQALRDAVVFDGRNLFDPRQMLRESLSYYPIGRPAVRPA